MPMTKAAFVPVAQSYKHREFDFGAVSEASDDTALRRLLVEGQENTD